MRQWHLRFVGEQFTGLDVPLNSRNRVLSWLMFAGTGVRNTAALPPALGARELSHFIGTSSTGFVVVAVLPLPLRPLAPERDIVHTARSCRTNSGYQGMVMSKVSNNCE
jgi:hypothetical protein